MSDSMAGEAVPQLDTLSVKKVPGPQLSKDEYEAFASTQRLGIAPFVRLPIAVAVSGLYGVMNGFYKGYTLASLRYLAENAHRLPRTKGAWYFYYKRKNYVVLKDALVQSFKGGARFGSTALLYMGTEAYVDQLRGTIDLFSTITASGVVGLAYGAVSHLGRSQTLRSTRTFLVFGTAVGLTQDLLRFTRGNDVWYLRALRPSE